jgi:ketosteroid isomerase-like protein
MSQENVEIVRRAWKAWGERGVDAAQHYDAEDCVVGGFPEAPDIEILHGWEGLSERERIFFDAWLDLALEPVEFMDAGGNAVVAVAAISGLGAGSGAPLDTHIFFVYELRDGKIVRDQTFTPRSDALEAAGLSE